MIYRRTRSGELLKPADLAKELSVSPSAITKNVQRLACLGFVTYEPYGKIQLTDLGAKPVSFSSKDTKSSRSSSLFWVAARSVFGNGDDRALLESGYRRAARAAYGISKASPQAVEGVS